VHWVIATTHKAASEFTELGVDSHGAHRLSLVPLGVDLQRFKPVDGEAKGANYFLACTRLSKEKDPDFILDIASLMKKRNIDLPIIIAGMGPRYRKCRSGLNLKV
jgi:glycosyltransferase involved in cell wall biosynthesis